MNKNNLYLEYEGKVVQKLPAGYFNVEVMKGVVGSITASVANRLKSTNRR